jgi:hypothetical protein
MSARPRFISPDEIEKTAYPYRRVWNSLIIESSVLLGVCLGVYFGVRLLGITLGGVSQVLLEIVLALVPAGLWLVFSLWRERAAIEPRERLWMVALLTGLAANAITLPAAESVFQTSRWLPGEGAQLRIIGFAVTLGMAQMITQYIIVYYTTYPRLIRVREDAIAYFLASGVGFSTVISLRYITEAIPTIDVLAVIVFTNASVTAAMSLLGAFGLAEMRFANPLPFVTPLMTLLGALVFGFSQVLRSGLVNAGFTIRGALASYVFGLAFSAAVLVAVTMATSFFFRTAARREEEARADRK